MSSWKRVYWSIWLANLITSVGMMSFLPFFPTHLRGLGLTDPDAIAAWSGVIFGAAPLMAALMGPVWGSLGDRLGRKLMVLRALVAIGFFIGCMAFASTPGELLVLRLCQGVFSGFVAPSITLVSVSAPVGAQGRVTGSLQTALAVGTIAGPLLGAFVEAEHGLATLFLCVSAAAFTSALVVLVAVREPEREREPDRAERRDGGERAEPGRRARLGAALRRVAGDLGGHVASRELRSVLALVFCVQFAVGTTLPLLELYVEDLWTGDPGRVPALTATLFSLMAATDLLFMPLWGALGDRRGHRAILVGATLLTGAALVLHALVAVYAGLVVARLLLGIAYAGLKPSAFGLTAELTSVQRRGSAVGMVLSARQLAVSVSATVGGVLAAALGLPGLFATGGLVLCAVGAASLLAGRRARCAGGARSAPDGEDDAREPGARPGRPSERRTGAT